MAKSKRPASKSTTRYVAFLRAINVGGRVVKMAELKAIFEAAGLSAVETFIASGNVIFESPLDREVLSQKIEKRLEVALGYQVTTMLRTDEEVAAIAVRVPFTAVERDSAHTVSVGFLRESLAPAAGELLAGFNTNVDEFRLLGNELFWLLRVPQNETKFVLTKFEKKLGCKVTFRNLNTVQRLAAKFPPRSPT